MNLKLLPYTSRATVDMVLVNAVMITTSNRVQRPYPPGAVKVNGNPWPDGAHIGAVDAVLTWAHRNRRAQAGWSVVAQDAPSVAIGPEGTYKVEVLIDDIVIPGRTQTGITGTSFTYTLAERSADDPNLEKPVRFRITPMNGALTGTPRLTDPFVMQP